MRIQTREQAIEAGEATFYTGRPCKKGHLSYRYTINGNCSECAREASRDKQQRLRSRIRERQQAVEANAGEG